MFLLCNVFLNIGVYLLAKYSSADKRSVPSKIALKCLMGRYILFQKKERFFSPYADCTSP